MCALCAGRLGIRPRERTPNASRVPQADSELPPSQLGNRDKPLPDNATFSGPSGMPVQKTLKRPD
jgi:hypothetical protein